MNKLNRLSTKILALCLVPLLLVMVLCAAVILPAVQSHFLKLKMQGLDSIMDTANGALSALDRQVQDGKMTREQAQALARDIIHSMRFQGMNYIWAQSRTARGPRFEVHPVHPDWEGRLVDELGDARLPGLIRQLEATTDHSSRGTLYYDFGKPGQLGLFPKVSVMQRFDSWGWILGAGVYLDDVKREALIVSLQFLAILGVMTILMVIAARWMTAKMIRPLKALVEGLRHSDLRHHLEVDSEDEFGEAASAFNSYNDGMRQVVQDVKSHSERVASQSVQLASTAEEMARTVQEIAHSSEEMLVTGQQSSGTMRDLAHEIGLVMEETERTVGMTREAVDQALAGAESGRNTSSDMEKIQVATAKISKAVTLIQDLAVQTNLLSLNAAIEAAKAREHGRGFSVVAEEVRKLAERSRSSADEIQTLIRETHVAVQEGAQSVEATLKALQGIHERIGRVADAIMRIGGRAKEQAHSSAMTAQQVDQTTQQIETSASATHELAATVEEVARTAEELSTVAEGLRQAVVGFKM
jgi:methyl-accepting chemotaxis protein